jgi:phage recombination protein Bet
MPTKELVKVDNSQQITWDDEDKVLIRQTVAKGASDAEFKLLLYTASKYDLDPLVKQIWCVKYGDKPAAIYTSRDGFLHLAHKSGQFDGMETVATHNAKGELTGAKCTVWRKDFNRPFVVEVALSEYFVKQNSDGKPNQWAIRPETMIKKVAESQCLRRAFDISGLYEPGEMGDEGEVVESTARPVEPVLPSEPVTLRPDISERLDRAADISQETGIDTITDTFGAWARITQAQCEAGLRTLIKAADIPTAAKILGYGELNPVIKEKYPDADVSGKMYSAILHLAHQRRQEAREAADAANTNQPDPARNKAAEVFEDAVVTVVPAPGSGEAEEDRDF